MKLRPIREPSRYRATHPETCLPSQDISRTGSESIIRAIVCTADYGRSLTASSQTPVGLSVSSEKETSGLVSMLENNC